MKKMLMAVMMCFVIFSVAIVANAQEGGTTNNNSANAGANAGALAIGVGVGIGTGGSVVGSGNSTVGNGVGNFSPSAKIEKGAVVANGGAGGAGGNASAAGGSATIEKGAIDNRNTAIQGQGQKQKQKAVAKSDQTQFQSANNEGVTQTVQGDSVKYEDKRDLINPAPVPTSDVKLVNTKAFDVKSEGINSFFARKNVTYAQAKKASEKAVDVKVINAIIEEKDFRTDSIQTLNPTGESLGFLYLTPNGEDCPGFGMAALASFKAMEVGATGVKLVKFDTGIVADGSAWNVGIGGGASMFVKGDDIAVAPGAGIGYGKAKALMDARPAMVVEVFFDRSLVILPPK